MPTDREHTFRRPPLENWEAWGVGSTPMPESEAEEIAAYICDAFSEVHAFAVDPRFSYTMGLDRWAAEMLRDAMEVLKANVGNVGNVLDDVNVWLEAAAP
jgi:hypothetical protein